MRIPLRAASIAALLSAAAAISGLFTFVARPASAAEPGAGVVVEKDIVYGKGGTVDLKLDLARPEVTEGLRPGIVYIHGGGWSGGNRAAYKNDIQEAAKRGYVAVTIEYRLTQPDKSGKAKYPFPAQIEDFEVCRPLVAGERRKISRRSQPHRRHGRVGRRSLEPLGRRYGCGEKVRRDGWESRRVEQGAVRRQLFWPDRPPANVWLRKTSRWALKHARGRNAAATGRSVQRGKPCHVRDKGHLPDSLNPRHRG